MKIPKGKLKPDGDSGDGKRMFIVGTFNDGSHDLRIEIDTDDCDGDFARACAKELIKRWNAGEKK